MSILDYHLQHVLFRILDKQPVETRHQLRNISRCGRRSIPTGIGTRSVVAVLRSNTGEATTFGQMHCRNPHACPVCSAKIMEVYRAKIASALDEEFARGYFGFMATFTVPHMWFMSCRETTDILYETWKYFRLRQRRRANRTWVHPYYEFAEATGTKSWVRVCEYTYGDRNGWHPHFHCILWTPKEHFDEVLDWERKLCDFWISQAKRITLKYWREHNLHSEMGDLEVLLERVFAHQEDWNQSLRFSRDQNGKLLRATSSEYLTGWGSDREATGNRRKEASHAGHYTPYQILEKAEHSDKWARKYIEFCLAVTEKPVHHRMNFSKDGIYKRVCEWQATHDVYGESLVKKKFWAAVTYFTADEWYDISTINRRTPVISNILYLAQSEDTEQLLFDYIRSLGIPPRRRLENICAEGNGGCEIKYRGEIFYVDEFTAEVLSDFQTVDAIVKVFNGTAETESAVVRAPAAAS